MTIGYFKLDLPEGKVKFNDQRLNALVDKCRPKKVSPFYLEFIPGEAVHCDAIVVHPQALLDVLILDMEKCEARLNRSEDENEKSLAAKCLAWLEEEKPLCDCPFSEEERSRLPALGLASAKPVLATAQIDDLDDLISRILAKSAIMFFYTVGPKEVHAWPVPRDSEIVYCAGRIHSDLARGFIRADLVSFNDFMQCFNMNECRQKGLVRVVDRGHLVEDGTIIEIRFNV